MARLSGMYSFEMNLGRTSANEEKELADYFLAVSVLVKADAIVLHPHVFATTRMARRLTPTKLLQRLPRRRGICEGVYIGQGFMDYYQELVAI